MEHAVMTRELMAHAIAEKRELHMIQIDFTNAFGSVPHGLIQNNMRMMGLPEEQIETVMNIYRGAKTVIAVPTGTSSPIDWKSGTVQGCPFSPTLFNICLESFLRRMEREEYLNLGYPVNVPKLDIDGRVIFGEVETIWTNAAAYADDLILYAETREGAQALLDALAEFCCYSNMQVNVKKCVSVSITWDEARNRSDECRPFLMRKPMGPCRVDNKGLPLSEDWAQCHDEEIPVERASIYLGMRIGGFKDECSLRGAHVLLSMKENIQRLGKSNLNITQKL
jgi:hypothetical protein